jgi:hypothetical protein
LFDSDIQVSGLSSQKLHTEAGEGALTSSQTR